LPERTNDRPSSSAADAACRSGRRRGANAAIVLVAIVAGLLLLEGALRLTPLRYLTHPTVRYPAGYFEADPALGVDLAPDRPPAPVLFRGPTFEAFTNALGCFDHDTQIGPGWLLAIGDSWTWGYAALQDKWTSHLERLSGRRIVKCGVSGTGPIHQRLKAEKTIAKVGSDPALIIVLYDSWNDLNDDAVFPGYAIVHGERVQNLKSLDLRTGAIARLSPAELERKYRRFLTSEAGLASRLRAHSVVAATYEEARARLDERWNPPAPPGPLLRHRYEFPLWEVDPARYPWLEQAFAAHAANILALKRLAEAHGAELVLITNGLPARGLQGRLRDLLARELPHVHDVAPAIEATAAGRRIHYHYDRHWNALGNRLAGEEIFRYLTDAGLLPSTPARAGGDVLLPALSPMRAGRQTSRESVRPR
jgi:hypothetical protein